MKLLSSDELRSEKGIKFSRSHLWRLVNAKKFPASVKLGENRITWPEEEIDAFIQSKIVERDRALR